MALQSSTRIIANQQTLQIFNLQREDYGVYQCFVSRGTREVQATAHLRLGGINTHLQRIKEIIWKLSVHLQMRLHTSFMNLLTRLCSLVLLSA